MERKRWRSTISLGLSRILDSKFRVYRPTRIAMMWYSQPLKGFNKSMSKMINKFIWIKIVASLMWYKLRIGQNQVKLSKVSPKHVTISHLRLSKIQTLCFLLPKFQRTIMEVSRVCLPADHQTKTHHKSYSSKIFHYIYWVSKVLVTLEFPGLERKVWVTSSRWKSLTLKLKFSKILNTSKHIFLLPTMDSYLLPRFPS